jgi:hypothetical protein
MKSNGIRAQLAAVAAICFWRSLPLRRLLDRHPEAALR